MLTIADLFFVKVKNSPFKDHMQIWKWRGWEVAKEAWMDKSAALGICHFSACVLADSLIVFNDCQGGKKTNCKNSLGLVWNVEGLLSSLDALVSVDGEKVTAVKHPEAHTGGGVTTSTPAPTRLWRRRSRLVLCQLSGADRFEPLDWYMAKCRSRNTAACGSIQQFYR